MKEFRAFLRGRGITGAQLSSYIRALKYLCEDEHDTADGIVSEDEYMDHAVKHCTKKRERSKEAILLYYEFKNGHEFTGDFVRLCDRIHTGQRYSMYRVVGEEQQWLGDFPSRKAAYVTAHMMYCIIYPDDTWFVLIDDSGNDYSEHFNEALRSPSDYVRFRNLP